MKSYLSLLLIILFISIPKPGFMAPGEEPWLLKKNEKNVAVYSRSAANSNFKEIKVVTNVKTSLSSIVTLLRDITAFRNWVYRCDNAYLVKSIDNHNIIYYQKSDVPWPASDRDMVIHSRLWQDPVTKVIRFNSTAVPEHLPENTGVVRIRKFKGSWTLTPKTDGTVTVEYQVGLDPGGLIPAWIVNMASTDGPFITTLNFKEAIKSPKYQLARLNFIEELN